MSKTLGIDIGTTKVAAVIFDPEEGILEHASIETKAAVSGLPANFAEQNAARIAETVNECVRSFSETNRRDVAGVGITGQMHGVLLWSGLNDGDTSNLVTWQDKRCDSDGFLAAIAKTTNIELKSGFGTATLAWMRENDALAPVWKNAGTIMDWIVARLCGLTRAVIDPTLAASWGAFDISTSDWSWDAVDALRIPRFLMPEINPSGTVAGNLTVRNAESWGLTAGIPVCVAIGDNQASLIATLEDWDSDIALTLGTGGQVSVVVPDGVERECGPESEYEIRPFVEERFIAVGASLAGGSAFAWLVQWFGEWCDDFGIQRPDDKRLYELFIQSGLEANNDELRLEPYFLGKRSDPNLDGRISGIDMKNFTPGNLSRSLAFGIISDLKSMLPERFLVGKSRVVASGNALRRNPLLVTVAQEVFGYPVELIEGLEEAACGAAILASNNSKTHN